MSEKSNGKGMVRTGTVANGNGDYPGKGLPQLGASVAAKGRIHDPSAAR